MEEVPLSVMLLGFAATVLSLIYRVPQIWKLYQSRSGKDLSLWMIHMQNLSYVGYIAYGYLVGDLVYLVSSILSLLQNFVILGMIRAFNSSQPYESIPIESQSTPL